MSVTIYDEKCCHYMQELFGPSENAKMAQNSNSHIYVKSVQ